MKKGEVAWNRGLRGVCSGWKLSEVTKRRMSLSRTGLSKSIEVRQKIRQSNLGKHSVSVVCPKCGVSGGESIMKRWHFDKCGSRNRSEFKIYLRAVHHLTTAVYREHKQVINPHSYPRTRCGIEGGYQLDHKISVKEGFERKLPIHEIAHINNLQMLSWKENRNKGVQNGV
jgi:hypothetical protein